MENLSLSLINSPSGFMTLISKSHIFSLNFADFIFEVSGFFISESFVICN